MGVYINLIGKQGVRIYRPYDCILSKEKTHNKSLKNILNLI